MEIKTVSFSDIKKLSYDGIEGIVLLGAGGDLNEWINGISGILKDEKIAKENVDVIWKDCYTLTSTGGRTDLVLVPLENTLEWGKLAVWRLVFGDCSWISDYVVNYRKDF